MRIVVDRERCGGHGRCVAVAPELFDLDDDGISLPLVDELATDQEAAAKDAIANCPQSAIRID
ncbi:ferredoxin [Gordonia paraffinivorans]|uniref:ferredoxin n=1 Tax=Gordonia paraffinivorans TaxID=175628 RepID=UPI000D6176BE|nr:ferredoxin [Gordonia paraffinivorans]MBY4573347.1 ferredoxin [Gordonia paraffinivorans]PWD43024.1 ferredoxin [Gordonia paraffinivorans]